MIEAQLVACIVVTDASAMRPSMLDLSSSEPLKSSPLLADMNRQQIKQVARRAVLALVAV